MAIVFEEINAEIALPPAGDGGNSTGASSAPAPDQIFAQVQDQLAVQRERMARLAAD